MDIFDWLTIANFITNMVLCYKLGGHDYWIKKWKRDEYAGK